MEPTKVIVGKVLLFCVSDAISSTDSPWTTARLSPGVRAVAAPFMDSARALWGAVVVIGMFPAAKLSKRGKAAMDSAAILAEQFNSAFEDIILAQKAGRGVRN